MDTRPAWMRQLNASLDALGYVEPHSAQSDLAFVETLVRGEGKLNAERKAGLPRDSFSARWRAMISEAVATGCDGLTAQGRLLDCLRARAHD